MSEKLKHIDIKSTDCFASVTLSVCTIISDTLDNVSKKLLVPKYDVSYIV